MSPEEVTEIRARHQSTPVDTPLGPDQYRTCSVCVEEGEWVAWPCDVVRLLDALQEEQTLAFRLIGEVGQLNDKLAWVQGTPYEQALERAEKAESELARVSEVLIQRLADLRALRVEYEKAEAERDQMREQRDEQAARKRVQVKYHRRAQAAEAELSALRAEYERVVAALLTVTSDHREGCNCVSCVALAGAVPSDAEPEQR